MLLQKFTYDNNWTDITPTGLNGLGNGGSVVTNSINNNDSSNRAVDYEFIFTYRFGSNPNANSNITISVEASSDGTNWTDVQNASVLVILTADTNTHRFAFSLGEIMPSRVAPVSLFRIRIANNGGQALASSGNSLVVRKVYGLLEQN